MIDRRLLTLTAGVSVVGANSLALSPISAAVGADLGVAAGSVMTASALYGAATALSALTLAPRIDGVGPARALAWALATLAAALAAAAAAPSLTALAAAQALAGVAAGCALPAIYALAAQVAPPGRAAQALGIVLTGWTVSMVAGVALAALAAQHLDWRVVFAAMAAVAASACAVVRSRADWGDAPAAGPPTWPVAALRVPGAPAGLLACLSYMTAFYGAYTYLGPHVTGPLGRTVAEAGLPPLAYGLGFGAAALADRLIDRAGPARVAPWVFAALTAAYGALAAAAGSFWAVTALAAVWGVINHLGLTLIVGALSALDPARRGAVLGLNSAVTYVAVFVGAVGFKPVFDMAGWSAVALASAVCVAPALAQAALARRRAA